MGACARTPEPPTPTRTEDFIDTPHERSGRGVVGPVGAGPHSRSPWPWCEKVVLKRLRRLRSVAAREPGPENTGPATALPLQPPQVEQPPETATARRTATPGSRLTPVLRRSRHLRRIVLPWLAAAMLMLQALGLWHGVVHARVIHDGAHGTAQAFAGHDDGDPQCRLYDQLAHADLVFGVAPAWSGACADGAAVAAVPAGRLAPQAAGFLARGPPLTA